MWKAVSVLPRAGRSRFLTLAVLTPLAMAAGGVVCVACGAPEDEPAAGEAAAGQAAAEAPDAGSAAPAAGSAAALLESAQTPQQARPVVHPRGAAPGAEVIVQMGGLPPSRPVLIGFGALSSGYQMIDEGETDASGNLTTAVEVPENAERDQAYFFFVSLDHDRPLAVSDIFHVTAPDGTARVSGRITEEGVECTAVRGNRDELYTLAGDYERREPGQRVVVVGTIAADSTCKQGLSIQVREVRAAP